MMHRFEFRFSLIYLTLNIVYGIKWYEGSTIQNTGPDEPVWKSLWEYGICNDKVEFNQGTKVNYLGMDVFMRFLGKYEGSETILMIHQVNVMTSRIFRDNLAPRELFTGRLISQSELKTSKQHIDPIAGQLSQFCSIPEYERRGQYITGFSVANQEMYLVCSNHVLKFPVIPNLVGQKWNNPIETLDRKKICMDSNQQSIHPIFCDRQNGMKLMSITAVPKQVSDQDPLLFGYYSAGGGQSEKEFRREYKVAVYSFKSKQLLVEKSANGFLTEIDVYQETNTGFKGMYFTTDGNACPFEGNYSELYTNGKVGKVDFEYLEIPRKPCGSMQSYIGCPMGFCFDNRFDASFTVDKKIYFIKGLFYWILEDTGLPLDIPRVKDAHKPIRYIPPQKKPPSFGLPWLLEQLGKAWEEVQKTLGLASFYSNSPCVDYIDDQESAVCMTRNTGAAFTRVDASGKRIIYLYETNGDQWFVSEAGVKDKGENMRTDPFTGQANTKYDAAWWNQRETTVYLFSGDSYIAYKYQGAEKPYQPWFEVRRGKLTDFGIQFPFLDAVVNRNGLGYFFYQNFYHDIREETWQSKDKRELHLSLQSFFDVRKECYYNQVDQYEDLVSRYLKRNFSLVEEDKPKIGTPRPDSARITNGQSLSKLHIPLIIGVGVIIVILAWTLMFAFGGQDNKKPGILDKHYSTMSGGSSSRGSRFSWRDSKKSGYSLPSKWTAEESRLEPSKGGSPISFNASSVHTIVSYPSKSTKQNRPPSAKGINAMMETVATSQTSSSRRRKPEKHRQEPKTTEKSKSEKLSNAGEMKASSIYEGSKLENFKLSTTRQGRQREDRSRTFSDIFK